MCQYVKKLEKRKREGKKETNKKEGKKGRKNTTKEGTTERKSNTGGPKAVFAHEIDANLDGTL